MTGMADPGAAEQLSQMIRGSWISQIVGTLAQLGIADHLARGPQQSGVLAAGIGCEADATFRLLRAAVNIGLVSRLPDASFGLTPMGELLRSDVPGSLRDSAIAFTTPGHWLPWGRLAEVVRRGERQTVAALGHELFDYYAVNPGEGRAFTGAMANVSNAIASELARLLDTSGVNHVVDIGGASGTIVGALLEANPALRGTIFERADVGTSS
jgi:O-methyltransferase domain/Dimerisation domain